MEKKLGTGALQPQVLRIYNPIKNSYEHDPKGEFIKQWLPELSKIPQQFVHEPHKMTALDQKFSDFRLGVDYPRPIIDLKNTRKRAGDTL